MRFVVFSTNSPSFQTLNDMVHQYSSDGDFQHNDKDTNYWIITQYVVLGMCSAKRVKVNKRVHEALIDVVKVYMEAMLHSHLDIAGHA